MKTPTIDRIAYMRLAAGSYPIELEDTRGRVRQIAPDEIAQIWQRGPDEWCVVAPGDDKPEVFGRQRAAIREAIVTTQGALGDCLPGEVYELLAEGDGSPLFP